MTEHLHHATEVPGLNDPVAHAYSHSVRAGDLLFLAGQCGTDDTGTVANGFDAQARLSLDRVRRVVEQAGGTLRDIASMTVFLTDICNGERFVQIRRDVFGTHYPASALIGVSFLMPAGALVEVQAQAVLANHTASPQLLAGGREEI